MYQGGLVFLISSDFAVFIESRQGNKYTGIHNRMNT
jgi:hypothetical protein